MMKESFILVYFGSVLCGVEILRSVIRAHTSDVNNIYTMIIPDFLYQIKHMRLS